MEMRLIDSFIHKKNIVLKNVANKAKLNVDGKNEMITMSTASDLVLLRNE